MKINGINNEKEIRCPCGTTYIRNPSASYGDRRFKALEEDWKEMSWGWVCPDCKRNGCGCPDCARPERL